MHRRHCRTRWVVVALSTVALATTACTGTGGRWTQPPTPALSPSATDQGPSPVSATSRPDPTPIVDAGQPAPVPDGLVTAAGPFDLTAFRGRPVIVFFGYTHCPDVCPATIGELMQVVDHRPDVRVVFVTVDPERDTPAYMAKWTEFMPRNFVGVTGSPKAIKAAADAYRVRYARVDSASAAGYSMSHTAFQYLIDADGRLRLHFPFGTGWKSILATLDTVAPPAQEVPS